MRGGPVKRSFGEEWSKNMAARSHTIRDASSTTFADWLTLRQIVRASRRQRLHRWPILTGPAATGCSSRARGVKQVQQVSATTSRTEALVRFRNC
jgi:hypothetical protein